VVRTGAAKLLVLFGGPVVLALGFAVVVVTVLSGSCDTKPSGQAKHDIPPKYLDLYQQAGRRYDIDPAFLAAVGAQETDHGRAPGADAVNPSGCVGPMQIGLGGQCGDEWSKHAVAGTDGRKDPNDPGSAIFTAAKILREQKHAPSTGGSEADYHRAACDYYGSCSDRRAGDYAGEVMRQAKVYGFQSGHITPPVATAGIPGSAGCSAASTQKTIPGRVQLAAQANRPGAGLHPQVMGLIGQTAGIVGHPLTVATGTNHSESTVDGNESDHWTGDAADIDVPTDSPQGNQIATAALEAAGLAPADAQAKASQGGLYSMQKGRERIQVIWKTDEGGNHHDHVHIGDKPMPASPSPGGEAQQPGASNPVPTTPTPPRPPGQVPR
jgi:hypothetical protein